MLLPLGTAFSPGRGPARASAFPRLLRKRLSHVAGFLCSSGSGGRGRFHCGQQPPSWLRCPANTTQNRRLKSSRGPWVFGFDVLTFVSDLWVLHFLRGERGVSGLGL